MRAARRLFIHHERPDRSHFTLVYSNNTAVRASLCPAEGSEGRWFDDLALVIGSLVPGRCDETPDGLRIMLDDGRDIVLRSQGTGWSSSDGSATKAIRDKGLIEAFSRRFCRDDRILPVRHPYDALVHARPELAKNFLVSWFLGNPCSFSCSYCPPWLHDGTQPWRDYEVVAAFCDRLVDQVPRDRTLIVEFGGGEVTLWKDYARLCRYLKSKGVVVSMITNGSRRRSWWEENYAAFDVVQMSYHTEFTRREEFLALCEFLKGRVDLRVYVMMPPGKTEECLEVATQIAAQGIGVDVKPLTDDLMGELTAGYTDESLCRLNEFNKTVGLPKPGLGLKSHSVKFRDNMVKQTASGQRTPVQLTELITNRENTWYGWQCFIGPEQIVIDGSGYVYRGWCKVGKTLGHIGDASFEFAVEPILCDKELCHCNFDIFSTKINAPGEPGVAASFRSNATARQPQPASDSGICRGERRAGATGDARLLLNVYYNRDEGLPFLREIVSPLLAAWRARELVDRFFYRRSVEHGEHFRLFLTLTNPTPELETEMERELAAMVARRPSSATDAARDVTLFFGNFPNNSVHAGTYDQRDAFTQSEPLKRPLEDLAVCCCSWKLRHLDADWHWPGVALALADALLAGLQMDVESRIACVNACLEAFVPASLAAGRNSKESSDEVRRLLEGVRRDFLVRRTDYALWLDEGAPAPVRAWAAEVEALCAQLAAACQSAFGDPTAKLAGDPRAPAASVMLTAFLGVIDQLLLDEVDVLATASRLRELYQYRAAGGPA